MKNHAFHPIGTMVVLALTAIQSLAQSTYEPYTFTTLAGGGGYSTNVAGSAARLNNPGGVAGDNAGNAYVADTFNHAIRKVTPAGVVTTLAGLPGTFGSADGSGSDARFYYPDKLTVDDAGNVYVSDSGNNTIRKVTPEGVVTTLAGYAGVTGSADGMNVAARFNGPEGIAVSSAGDVFVADAGNCTIRKLAAVGTNWVVTTVAGNASIRNQFGVLGGDADGTNKAARFNYSQGLAIDRAGNLYVADTDNHSIRKVTPAGTNWVVTTLAGNSSIKDQFGNPIGGFADGTNHAARFFEPKGIVVDNSGNLYVADEGNHTIRMASPSGTNWVVTTPVGLAPNPGSADGTNNATRFADPYGVGADPAGNVYVADLYNDAIRKLTPVGTNWVVTTLAGVAGNYGSLDGPGNVALFKGPAGVTVDGGGNIYVADQLNQTIRKVTAAGEVTTLAGLAGYGGSSNGTNNAARFYAPQGVAVDSAGNLYAMERGSYTIRKLTPVGTNWVATTLAGLAFNEGSTDGFGNAARFAESKGLAVDGAGNVYVADSGNFTIRRVSPAGLVTTWAGLAGNNGSADGAGSTARFNNPTGVAVDTATNVYVADTWNHTIRKISPARVVRTLAGLAGSPGSADGIGPGARFNYPAGITVDRANNVYVADTYHNTIRKLALVGTNWVVTTLGGIPGIWGSADGRGSAARFSNPNGVAVDSLGNVYVADFYLNTIRKGYAPPRILAPGFNSGQFGFSITGPPGKLVVEASSDLVGWLPISTNTFTGTLNFSDRQGDQSGHRYYRVQVR
jgi:streptogramin lyase